MDTTCSSKRWRNRLALCIIALWGTGMILAFWWFQARYIRPFDTQGTFDATLLRPPSSATQTELIRVVHFWDPDCPCNFGVEKHLGELMEQFQSRPVRFYFVTQPDNQGKRSKIITQLTPLAHIAGQEALPASPAIAIWDQKGQLAYFGPYSDEVMCNSKNSLVEPIIEALLTERSVKVRPLWSVGCFCDWQSATNL